MRNNSFNLKKCVNLASGFTVVELMVTITIVVLVTGLIMVQYSSFNSSVLLTSQAYLTAFDIREAQSMAIGVRRENNTFRQEYGMYFDMLNPNQYRLFQDVGGDEPVKFDSGETIGEVFRVDPRFIIVDICAGYTGNSSELCYSTTPALSNISISFKRPDFDAAFYSPGKSSIDYALIKFGTQNSTIVRTVKVYQTGQITID